MGTRGLTAVMVDREYKIAQYGQWDHYLSGQGIYILTFLRNVDLDIFKAKVRTCRFGDDAELQVLWEDPTKKPFLTRDTGGKILQLVNDAEPGVVLGNQIDFAGDSLFCEFAYVVDLDQMTFEVYKGFNQEPVAEGERFAKSPTDGKKYHPVKLLAEWKLDALPSDETFLKCGGEEDEE